MSASLDSGRRWRREDGAFVDKAFWFSLGVTKCFVSSVGCPRFFRGLAEAFVLPFAKTISFHPHLSR